MFGNFFYQWKTINKYLKFNNREKKKLNKNFAIVDGRLQ